MRTRRPEKVIVPAAADALVINLRHLHAFLSVSSAGSVARAADALFRVSSAVTRSVAELEASLGTPLFERRARGMLLNAYGELVLLRARRIELEFAAARISLEALKGGNGAVDARSLFPAMLNGRRLAVFASLAEKHNMPAVAREFGITQPAISASLKDLESRLGLALFERSAQGVTPTDAGALLAFHFKRVLSELRHLAPDIAAVKGTLLGTVNIGALPLGRTLLLPSAIAAVLAAHPGLRVTTVESPYEVLAAGLRSGDIDFILGALRPPQAGKDLHQEALFEDRISVIARAGHPLLRRRRIGFDDLQRARWVLSRQGSPSRELLERSFREAAQALPAPAVETGDLAILRGLLLQSDMLTAISAQQLHYEIAAGTLVVLPFPLDATRRSIGLTQRLGAFPSPGTRALVKEIRRVVDRTIGPV
jgi:LysR family transcriptional regulator of gallate degradation